MSNTEQAQEPTMEEILASIRRIISDDDKPEEDAAEAEVEVSAEPEDEAMSEAEMDQAMVDEIGFDPTGEAEEDVPAEEPETVDDDVLELTEVVADEPAEEPVPEETAEEIDFDALEVDEEPEPVSADVEFVDVGEDEGEPDVEPFKEEPAEEPMSIEEQIEGRIMSEGTDTAVASAFGQLATTLLSRDGTTRTLEELVQEMLRPMLKSWLDDNLPAIVEELVRQEIERAARRGGR